MTFSKSQGETFEKKKYLNQNKPIFRHCQLYVALSVCSSKHDIKVQIVSAKNDVEKVYFKNVGFTEVLQFYSFFFCFVF